MRKLTTIKALNDFCLECEFSDGSRKIADIKPYLMYPVFAPLNNQSIFSSTIYNGVFFVEWKGYEVDLSADTLWHIGKDVIPISK